MMDDKYIFKRAFILEILNLHPGIVWMMIAIDILVFAAELFTFGIAWVFVILVSFLFGLLTVYVQMTCCGDEFPLALGKAIVASLIILAPSPLLMLMYMTLYTEKRRRGDGDEDKIK